MIEARPPQRVDWTLERFVNARPPAIAGAAERCAPPLSAEAPYVGPVLGEETREGFLWVAVLQWVQIRLSEESFRRWFADLKLISLDESGHSIRLLAPNKEIRSWVAANYTSLLHEALDSSGGSHGFSFEWAILAISEEGE